jgi:hypothetical protein
MLIDRKRTKLLPLLQGAYFVGAGVWPLLHIKSFQKVTGPKKDLWLVKTVGILVAIVGATLAERALKGKPAELRTLGIGSAAGLAAVDINYSLKGRISKIYLLDAVAEIVITALWFQTKK